MKTTIILTLVLSLFFAKTEPAQAQAEWLEVPPGYTIADGVKYWAESLKETISLWLTFDNHQKAYRYLEQAEERVAEAEALATRKQYRYLKRTVLRYQQQLEKAELLIEQIKETSASSQGFEEKLAQGIIRQQAVLYEVSQRVPEEEQETIEAVLEVTQNKYQEVIEKISEPARSRITEQVQERIPDLSERLPQRMRLRVPGLIKKEDIKELETSGQEEQDEG